MNTTAPRPNPAPHGRLRPGDRVAVVSPSFAAPSIGPEVHEQALRRIEADLGLIPVEYPATRRHPTTAVERAADVNAAFADPRIRAIFATLGGEDQITVVPHIDDAAVLTDPKPFFGYSDNTNLHNHLHGLGVASFYGGSTQVHLGAGPHIDDIHLASLRAALFDGGELEITDPGEMEDFGVHWASRGALTQFGHRRPTRPWEWAGPSVAVEGPTWGGCLEVLADIGLAGRFPAVDDLRGAILLVETAEGVPPVAWVRRWMRALGEAGILGAVAGVVAACPPTATLTDDAPSEADRRGYADDQAHAIISTVAAYNPEAPVCVGVPFGHTRPQWVLPYGGRMRLNGVGRRVFAYY
ncbi:S66 peptidase family protein [uncultured Corynebacterium sp.]|uniref:S66 family peptidase n=1 Tax=uncultured Corynebacterium sp. TaxID=159447 RepID=UPI0025E9186F|nr:S66 peptidase family protein [uncultured Corynebacterium sp.]